jgi:hypothetical protein
VVRDTQFPERLHVCKQSSDRALARRVLPGFEHLGKRYEDGEYESPSQAEFAFRRLVDEESRCRR